MRRYEYNVAKYGETAREYYASIRWLVVIPVLKASSSGAMMFPFWWVFLTLFELEREYRLYLAAIVTFVLTIAYLLLNFETHEQVRYHIEEILENHARAAAAPPVRVEVAREGGRVLRYTKLPPRPQMLRLANLTLDRGLLPKARDWADAMGWGKTDANKWQQLFAADGWLYQPSGRGSGYEWTEAGYELLERYHSPAPNDEPRAHARA